LSGTLLQLFNHGLIAAAAFCLVGFLEQRSGGLRGVGDFGGLRKVAPVFAGFMGVALFASMGLPGLGGFVGEFLIFRGVFGLASWAAALAATGLLMTAVFLLTLMLRVFHGPLNPQWTSFRDLTLGERTLLAPALLLILLLGVCPQTLAGMFNATVHNLALLLSR
jgi:NADH-quinone oxidoreductase subunit M